eukprot:g68996.t1
MKAKGHGISELLNFLTQPVTVKPLGKPYKQTDRLDWIGCIMHDMNEGKDIRHFSAFDIPSSVLNSFEKMQLGLEQSVLRVPLLNPARVPATPLAPPHAAALALLGLLCLTRTCLHFWADRPGWLAARSLANLPHADRTDQQSQQTQAISRENGFVPGVLPPPLAAQSAVNVNAMAITCK